MRHQDVTASRLERVVAAKDRILKNRRWAKRMGYVSLQVVDSAKIRTPISESDPTGNVVVTQENIRKAAEHGEQRLDEGIKALEEADRAFTLALRLVDNRRPLDRENWDPAKDEHVSKGEQRERQVDASARFRRDEDFG